MNASFNNYVSRSPSSSFFGPSLSNVLNWREHAVKRLESWETQLDNFIPPFEIQNSYDKMMEEITEAFAGWQEFNRWLEDSGNGSWYAQLATFLVKLPLKAARNILQLVGNIIAIALRAPLEVVMHPMKAPLRLAKLLVVLVHTLLQPETWTRIGAGVIGSSLAQSAIAGNPLGVLAIGIGGALVVAGISMGTLKTALFAKQYKRWDAVGAYLVQQAKHIPEDLLTGFCLGLLIEGAQRAMRAIQKAHHQFKHYLNENRVNKANIKAQHAVDYQNQQTIAISKDHYINLKKNEFLNRYNLPSPEQYDKGTHGFTVRWRPGRADISIRDLPEGSLFRENLQTGTQTVTQDVWIPGYYDTVSFYAEGYYNYANEWVPGGWAYQDVWVEGFWDKAVTRIPIYEEFFGYKVPVSFANWTSPPLLPPPIPKPLPIQPALPAAMRLPEEPLLLLGAGPALNEAVQNNNDLKF